MRLFYSFCTFLVENIVISQKKTERENRKAELGPVHKRIIEFISRYLMECEESVVEDFLLDSEKQLKLVNSFIQKGLLLSSAIGSFAP